MKSLLSIALLILLCLPVCALPKPGPVNGYSIHEDGGLVYDPLRREAESTGQLAQYKNARATKHQLDLGAYKVQFSVPRKATAYDVVPIRYKLSWKKGHPKFPVAVEATALEDEARRHGRDLYDLGIPGKIDLKVDYLGAITAHLTPEDKHQLKADMTDKPGLYPSFARKPLTRSGVVEAGDLVWFKFRFKNTGDTILDAEGMGRCQLYPEMFRKDDKGKYVFHGNPYNLYYRDLETLYPGESHEMWVHFAKAPYILEAPLEPGEYLIKFRMVYHWWKSFNAFINIWDGAPMYVYELPITVEAKPRQTPVDAGKVTLTDAGDPDKMTRWIHTHEEFMTSFDCFVSEPKSAAKKRAVEGTLHLQVAPWTKRVVIKLISSQPTTIRTAAVPIDVESDSLKIEFNPKTPVTVVKNGLREPAIWSQCMADMRTNVQIGPFPETHIRARLREMMDHGINVVAWTSMPWLYSDMNRANYQGDAWKYALDVCRKEGMLAEGWGAYPYDRSTIEGISNWITGKKTDLAKVKGAPWCIDHADPNLPKANADAWLYQFHRWGDLYYQMETGEVPIGIEDTRGWMRQDTNIRYIEGQPTIQAFRDWVKAKYGSLEATNTAWGTRYKTFDEIDPQADQVTGFFGQRPEYTDPKNPFHEWNQALEDFDIFRTELRMRNYADTLDIVRKEIPDVKFLLRTEGANVLVTGIDPEDPNSHMRHIYYSQRRCGAIADVVQKPGIVRWHSDYTTMPYTPTELRKLTRMSVKQGIIPIYLAQFDNMRDIAINPKYGTEFQFAYNLPKPQFGQIMQRLTALYPWFKAVYEEGGVPAILWEDYQCDGFATETQKREMLFFKEKLQAALNTPAAKKARAAKIGKPSQEWRNGSKALPSYRNR